MPYDENGNKYYNFPCPECGWDTPCSSPPPSDLACQRCKHVFWSSTDGGYLYTCDHCGRQVPKKVANPHNRPYHMIFVECDECKEGGWLDQDVAERLR